MDIEFDPAKDAINQRKHGIALARFADMDLDSALAGDAHHTATEQRYAFVGIIEGELWTAIVTYRGTRTRVISLRRANKRERREYAQAHEEHDDRS